LQIYTIFVLRKRKIQTKKDRSKGRPLKKSSYFDQRGFLKNKKNAYNRILHIRYKRFIFITVFYCRLYESVFD
jgi:hypothetical protein